MTKIMHLPCPDMLRDVRRYQETTGGVGLNSTSEIIYLQPMDSSAVTWAPEIYSSGLEQVYCAEFTTDNH